MEQPLDVLLPAVPSLTRRTEPQFFPGRSRGVAILTSLVVGISACTPTQTPTPKLDSNDDFLVWIAEHPSNAGLAAFVVGKEPEGIFYQADELFPLASTRKILILIAYAEEVADGHLVPGSPVETADVERWYWKGTDGGAHERARSRGPFDLNALAWAMTRWSDNAASDYVLERVGGPERVEKVAESFGLERQEPLMSTLGEFIGWATEEDWTSLTPAQRSERATRLAHSTSAGELKSLRMPSVTNQRRLARASVRGTPREWSILMAKLVSAESLGPVAANIVYTNLGWPMALPANQLRFTAMGTKGGSLPGVITEASYFVPTEQEPVAVALFLRNLPPRVEQSLGRSYLHQKFMASLAGDHAFLEKARAKLLGAEL